LNHKNKKDFYNRKFFYESILRYKNGSNYNESWHIGNIKAAKQEKSKLLLLKEIIH
jgi:hypothetical protein